jgi:CheY-like chemotaxis protein
VTQLGGHVEVESQIRIGSTFRVLLPVIIQSKREGLPESVYLLHGTESILFVEDEPSLKEIGQLRLQHLGYTVSAFTDSQAALTTYRKDPNQFDLVLTDMHMPGINGLELSREVRILRSDIPIIICTGNPAKIDDDRISELGINRKCTKPLALSKLAETLRAVLDA